jgi:hypothetical protein
VSASFPNKILVAAQTVASAIEASAAKTFVDALGQIVGPDFSVSRAAIVDGTGLISPLFPAVVHRATRGAAPAETVVANGAAAAIDLIEELTIDTLRSSYARIALAKRLEKTKMKTGENRTNITLGLIYARRSTISLELASEELYRLNSQTTYSFWPDMIVVDSVGVVNYAVQFPGESVSGDFLPPAEGAFQRGAPPIYIVVVMRPTAAHSFSKMVAFLIAHLQLFAPDGTSIKQLKWNEILDDVPKQAVTLLGFQPNLKGEIVPVPRDEYTDRFMPQTPVVVEDNVGDVLANIIYRGWQDGAVIMLAGKLPLEGLLVFLPNLDPRYLRVIRRPEVQLSYVLPISRAQFDTFLSNIEQRSNLVVKRNPGGFVIQKLMDEGVATPFIARCYMGLLRLRENVFPKQLERDSFDKIYETSLSSLTAARTASKELSSAWTNHVHRIASGEIARVEGQNLHILESVDKKMAAEFETFLNTSNRALKKQSAFENGLAKLRATDPTLADYLEKARAWTETLVKARNDLEHSIWSLPKTTYLMRDGLIEANEAVISDIKVTEFTDHYFDRLACFFEEVIAHLLEKRMPVGITITEIPGQNRTPDAPERFRITPAAGGSEPWKIRYHTERFEES